MPNRINHLYEFGPFRLVPYDRLLLRDGQSISIPPKAFDILVVLIERGGHLVEKQQLVEAVWPGLFVEEGNVTVMIHALRKALGSNRGDRKYIETVSKRGYRFVAEVRLIEAEPLPPIKPVRSKLTTEGIALSAVSNPHSVDRDELLPSGSQSASRSRRGTERTRLRWTWVVFLVAVLATILPMVRRVSPRKESTPSPEVTIPVRSLAVLPFTAIGEKNDDVLGLGISDAVITKLSSIGKLVIRPPSELERYSGVSHDPVAVGREQQVDAVLDGHIQRDGTRLRLTVQLIRVRDGARIWGETFNEKYTDVFSVEDSVAERVARSTRLELTGAEQRHLTQHPTENSDAYQAYMKGRYFWNKRTPDGLRKGLRYFQEAAAFDPSYTQAYAGIADSYALLGQLTVLPPDVSFPMARKAAAKTLEMDPELADAHATLGFVKLFYDFDGIAAENEFKRALQNNPDYALAHIWYSVDLAAMGRNNEALVEARRAAVADPLSLTINTDIGLAFYLAGSNDDAIDAIKKAIDIDPDFARAHFRLGNAYLQKKMSQQALAEYQNALRLSKRSGFDGDQYYECAIGEAYAISGNTREARNVLDRLIRRSKSHYVPAYGIALIYARLGERDAMFDWMKRAYEEHSTSMAYLKVDPAFNAFHSDPRFVAVSQSLRF
jgi:DNA-binding winged helix-turn-helix (wHTH) protein/TolB-like protein/Tfp pilus assembly protein PilF